MKGHGDGGLAGIAANVKKSNMLAPWLAFGMLSLVPVDVKSQFYFLGAVGLGNGEQEESRMEN